MIYLIICARTERTHILWLLQYKYYRDFKATTTTTPTMMMMMFSISFASQSTYVWRMRENVEKRNIFSVHSFLITIFLLL